MLNDCIKKGITWEQVAEALEAPTVDYVMLAEQVRERFCHIIPETLDHYGGKVTLSVPTQFGNKFEWFEDREKIASDVHPYCDSYDRPNTIVISPFTPEYEGYKCRVSNEAGFVESNDAELSKLTLNLLSGTIFCVPFI